MHNNIIVMVVLNFYKPINSQVLSHTKIDNKFAPTDCDKMCHLEYALIWGELCSL